MTNQHCIDKTDQNKILSHNIIFFNLIKRDFYIYGLHFSRKGDSQLINFSMQAQLTPTNKALIVVTSTEKLILVYNAD